MDQTQQELQVSVKEWIITFLLVSIPIVNIIMLFIWALGSDTNEAKANWAKAALIWFAILTALSFFFMIVLGGTMLSFL